MEDMTWWSYVQRVAGGDTNATIAKKVGVSPPSVSRWQGKNSADPATAAAFARAYDRPVLEAFVAAGFLTPEEAGERPSAPPSLASLTDEELIEEVGRRMKELRDAGTTHQKIVQLGPRRPAYMDGLPQEQAAHHPDGDPDHEGGNLDG